MMDVSSQNHDPIPESAPTDFLLKQYDVAAQQIRHQDDVSWKTFSVTLAIGGLGFGAIAQMENLFPLPPAVIFIGLFEAPVSFFALIHILRARRYQHHAYGVACEIESRLHGISLFGFDPNKQETYSKHCRFYGQAISTLAKLSARQTWISTLFLATIVWLLLAVVALLTKLLT